MIWVSRSSGNKKGSKLAVLVTVIINIRITLADVVVKKGGIPAAC